MKYNIIINIIVDNKVIHRVSKNFDLKYTLGEQHKCDRRIQDIAAHTALALAYEHDVKPSQCYVNIMKLEQLEFDNSGLLF